jgi:hypothetical protein
MAQATAAVDTPLRTPLRPERRIYRWRLWLPVLLIAGAIVYIAVIAMNWPFREQAVINVLEQRSLRTVTVGRFYRTYFPPGCTAEDVRFLHRKHKEKQPLITVQKLVLVTGYSRILLLQDRLSLVRVTDMHVTVPPTAPGQPNPVMPLTYTKSAPSIKIDRIIADGSILDFLSSQTDKKPYRLVIDKLRLDGIGNNLPMPYNALISNQMPPGKIRSAGVFGTWNPKDPGSTPVQGNYSFEKANLGVFGGLSGTLFSSGSFRGTLREIGVRGTADVPDFKVQDASHQRELRVAYRAAVNGTNGDTKLEEVTARFDETTAYFRGLVAKGGGGDGKTAAIDMWTERGRVEDILRLFISAKTAPMSGAFTFSGHAEIPPGPEPFLRRLKLTGDFGVAGGKFANARTESDLTRLSDSSHQSNEQPSEQPAGNVLSDLKGHGVAENGMATLSNVSFTIPGAKTWIHGTYGLIDYKVDLRGTLLTTGSPSKATTGFKSLVVKVITPLFKKKHEQKLVPIKLTGSYSKIDAALDLGRGEQMKSQNEQY